MFYSKKNINSIKVTKSNFVFKVKEKNENFEFGMNEIKNIYIGFNKNSSFYFIDFISFLIIGISVAVAFWFSLVNLFFIGIVVIIFRGIYLINYQKYFITVIVNNKKSCIFFFSNINKNKFLEKIKLIRGNINDINFLNKVK